MSKGSMFRRYSGFPMAVQLRGYWGHPFGDDLELAWMFDPVEVGKLSLDELVEEFEALLGTEVFHLEQRWKHTEWGASGAGLEILIGMVSGTAVLMVERIANLIARLASREHRRGPFTAESAVQLSRDFLAEVREVQADSIRVDDVEPIEGGFRVRMQILGGDRFTMDVLNSGGVHRLAKETPPGIGPDSPN